MGEHHVHKICFVFLRYLFPQCVEILSFISNMEGEITTEFKELFFYPAGINQEPEEFFKLTAVNK